MPTNAQYSDKAPRWKVTFERREEDTGNWKRGFARTRRFTQDEAIEAIQLNHANANKRNRTNIQYRNYVAQEDNQ